MANRSLTGIFLFHPSIPNYPKAKFPGVVVFSEIYQGMKGLWFGLHALRHVLLFFWWFPSSQDHPIPNITNAFSCPFNHTMHIIPFNLSVMDSHDSQSPAPLPDSLVRSHLKATSSQPHLPTMSSPAPKHSPTTAQEPTKATNGKSPRRSKPTMKTLR